ncbi:NmrA family NAD(P)-binding protein [Lentisalinibacter orientalis]|uniref:NmrA family NAD(P)-binding protein n=1 Tax=Lentisalinibacter orientalis TaxID=2992241 RepID=UPI00386F28E4
MKDDNRIETAAEVTLLTGGNGKVGRRVARAMAARGMEIRIGSRSGTPAFDWEDAGTWDAALAGVTAAYIAYAPDLAVTGAADTIRAFVARAVTAGVRRLVLLSGRGEEEAQACERIVQESGVDWTIVRAGWFMQNFSEGEFLPMVMDGAITLPARDIPEPFIDVNDIADVAAAALSEDGHAGEVYEVTGPRALTFAELAAEISAAAGREVSFVRIPQEAFTAALADAGVPADVAWLLDYLFGTVLDGRNTDVCDGVQRALGREPGDFTEFVHRVAASGTWNTGTAEAAA